MSLKLTLTWQNSKATPRFIDFLSNFVNIGLIDILTNFRVLKDTVDFELLNQVPKVQ